ncbi:hypothetical protein SHKM778_03730 [Streptomyces sp. KM77-8]|uniref:Uncharacterized protein n=1 Tax=Streptomyces haneummycinicus TaxID=3074435 RepID=A0AAT9H9D7_9ACTN
MAATHRIATGTVIAAVCVASLAGCGTGADERAPDREKAKPAPAPKNVVRLIGDGSTAYTGAQPHLPRPERLKPGEKPRSSWSSPGTARARTASGSSPTSARSPGRTTRP